MLAEAQFELSGVVFGGRDSDLIVTDFEPGSADVTTQDADNPVGDGVFPGVDRHGAASWQFKVATNCIDSAEALAAADRLAAAWRPNLSAGQTAQLTFRAGGRTRRVYGRPREFSGPVPDVRTQLGTARMEAEFVLTDPLVYDDVASFLQLDPPSLTHSGVTLPAMLPFVLGAVTGERQGVVHVGGSASVPFIIEVHGPITGHLTSPVVSAAGWHVAFPGLAVAYDQTLVVDMREHTALLDSKNVAGFLDGSSILNARLAPGSTEVTFDRVDSTNTASARLTWRAGYWSI